MNCREALDDLDNLQPSAATWDDSGFVMELSCLMIQVIPRRLGQRLIDAGFAQEHPRAFEFDEPVWWRKLPPKSLGRGS